MFSLDSGDKIRGDASAATVVDYIISGLDANAIKQLADGQLASGITDMFTADSADVVTSIILVNTDSSARTCNLYLTPNGGVARRLIPKDCSLGIGSSLITDGNKISVLDTSGQLLSTWAVDDTPVNGETTQPISSNWAFDHAAAADPHTGYVLESLLDAKGDGIFASADNAPAKVTVGANDTVLTADSAQGAGVKWATPSGGTMEFFVPISWGDDLGVLGRFFRQNSNGDVSYSYATFRMPSNFSSLTSAKFMIIPDGAHTPGDLDLATDYGADGEAYTTNQETDTQTPNMVGNQILGVDASGVLTGIAADDYVGITIVRGAAGHNFYGIGVYVKYA